MGRTDSLTVRTRRRSTRAVTYLRVSVTNRCSLRCLYCSPAGQARCYASLLSPAEIEQVVRVAKQLGVTHVRLTGGEPLERPDILEIVKRIKGVGIPGGSLTTNAVRLADLAGPLRRAGLARVNVGLPHVEADGFRRITGKHALAEVLAGIRAARAAGLLPVKTNTVVLNGCNDDVVCAIAELGRREGVTVRFIEYMTPTEPPAKGGSQGEGGSPEPKVKQGSKELFVPASQILRQLGQHFELIGSPGGHDGRSTRGPARYYRLRGGGVVGTIAPVSEPFCRSCNRLRLSATGKLRPCLYGEDEVDLIAALQGADPESGLADAFRRAIWMKPVEHGPGLPKAMRFIGG